MKKGTVTISWHGWRGIGVDRQLFMVILRLGFVTLGGAREVIDERLNRLHAALKALRGDHDEPR